MESCFLHTFERRDQDGTLTKIMNLTQPLCISIFKILLFEKSNNCFAISLNDKTYFLTEAGEIFLLNHSLNIKEPAVCKKLSYASIFAFIHGMVVSGSVFYEWVDGRIK